MLVFTCRFTQYAAVICKMDVSCIAKQQIVYWPVDVPSSVSKSGLKCVSRLQSMAYASREKNWALGSGVCIYRYPGGTASISEVYAHLLTLGGKGGIAGARGVSCGVGCLSRSCWGATVPLRLHCVCVFCAVSVGQGRTPSFWVSQRIARCISVLTFKFLCSENSTPRVFSSWTSAHRYMIRSCISSIAVCKNCRWPFWPYSTQRAYWTVLAVPDLLALP